MVLSAGKYLPMPPHMPPHPILCQFSRRWGPNFATAKNRARPWVTHVASSSQSRLILANVTWWNRTGADGKPLQTPVVSTVGHAGLPSPTPIVYGGFAGVIPCDPTASRVIPPPPPFSAAEHWPLRPCTDCPPKHFLQPAFAPVSSWPCTVSLRDPCHGRQTC